MSWKNLKQRSLADALLTEHKATIPPARAACKYQEFPARMTLDWQFRKQRGR
jgi:hypothetical protein